MRDSERRELARRFRAQHAAMSRSQLRVLGAGSGAIRRRVAAGTWEIDRNGVVLLAGAVHTPEQALMAACLAAGPTAVASHQSAGWLWGVCRVPDVHSVTVSRRTTVRLAGAVVHRPVDPPGHVVIWRGMPCTDPLRTLVDLSAVSGARIVEDAVDRALAAKLVTVEAIEAELGRLGRKGRAGAGVLRASLARRGMIGVPNPSVLESKVLRLLRSAGIDPIGVEVRMGEDGRYRVDALLAPTLVLEVDGFTYHSSPEAMTEDERRRRRLRLGGVEVLVYTWVEVVHDGQLLVREVRTATDRARAAGRMAAR